MRIQKERIGQLIVKTRYGAEGLFCIIAETHKDSLIVHTMTAHRRCIPMEDIIQFNHVKITDDEKRTFERIQKMYIGETAK